MQKQFGSKFFIVFLLLSLALLLSLFWTYMSALVLALLIASASYPAYSRIKDRLKGRELAASLMMTLLILLILCIPLSWFVSTLTKEAFDFYNTTSNSVSLQKLQKIVESDSVWAHRLRKTAELMGIEFTTDALHKLTGSVGKRVGLFLYEQGRSMASNLFSFLVHFFLMMMTLYYLFKDGVRLKEYIVGILPVPGAQLEEVIMTFQRMGRALIIGNGLSGVVQGILGGCGFFAFGLNAPFLWGTVIGFMAFLPIIGASIVFIPAAVILMIQGKVGVAIGFLIYNVSYSSIIEYIVKPRLIGQEMQMNPLLVFIGIIGGIKLFGILGIVYGPLIITIFMTLAEIYRMEYSE